MKSRRPSFVSSEFSCVVRLATALLFLVTPAYADNPNVSESLLEEGVSLRRRGQDAEALKVFERAYTLEPTPRIRAQIGFAQQALGLWIEAEMSLRTALEAQDDPWITRNQLIVRAALVTVEQHLGWLDLDCDPKDAHLTVNAASVVSGGTLRLPAGAVVVEARAEGRAAMRVVVNVVSGQHLAQRIVLEPLRPQSATLSAPGRAERSLPASPSLTPLSLGALVAGGTFLAIGIGAHLAREHHASAYNDDTRCNFGGIPRSARCADERKAGDLAAMWMGIGYAGAALFVTTFAVLSLVAPSRGERARNAACAPAIPLGAACGFGF